MANFIALAIAIANVPAVLLLEPLIGREDTRAWLLLGAVANLIVVEAAANLGYKLSFWQHLRFGLPLSAIALLIAYFWL